jgi:hypothetical protein
LTWHDVASLAMAPKHAINGRHADDKATRDFLVRLTCLVRNNDPKAKVTRKWGTHGAGSDQSFADQAIRIVG